MNTKIITYEKLNKGVFASGAVGSSILRGKWLVEAWPELTEWNHGDQADALIFQKAYWYAMMRDFPGKKILDLCDPDWMDGQLKLVEASQMVDAITCSNQGLTDIVSKVVKHIPVVNVPDRLNLNYFTRKKQHLAKAVRAVYFGFKHNAEVVLPQVLPSLARHGLELLVVSNRPVTFYATYGVTIKYVKWTEGTAYNDIQFADFALNPSFPNAMSRFKSNNKTLVAWGLGLPVANTAEEMLRFMDPAERQKEIDQRTAEIARDWDIQLSVKQYQDILAKIQR